LAWVASLILTAMWGHWPFVWAPIQMALGFGAAVGTGLLFGWYPAKLASELKPIDCLRAD
jgi:putative ABC transport system permease protein